MSSYRISSAENEIQRIPMPEPHLIPYNPSLTVAPRDVFRDYHDVMSLWHLDTYLPELAAEAKRVAGSSSGTSHDDTMEEIEVDNDEDYEAPKKHRRSGPKKQMVVRFSDSGPARSTGGRRGRKKHQSSAPDSRPKSLPDTDTMASLQCPYINPITRTRCTTTSQSGRPIDWTKDRHWKCCHLYAEAKQMQCGDLEKFKGTLIHSQAELDKALKKVPKCDKCKQLITRSDSKNRHMLNCGKSTA